MAGELIQVNVVGIQDVQRMLREAPKNIVARGFIKALDAAGTVILEEVDMRTPIRLATDTGDIVVEGGDLKAAIMKEVQLDANYRGGFVNIGFGKEQGHIALWVEYGHRLVTRGRHRQIGTVAPHPFMRPGLDAAYDRAIEAFARSLAATIMQDFPQEAR